MRWLHYFILSLVVLSGVFFGSSILTEKASAVSDLTVTYYAGDVLPANTVYFPSANYSDYNFIIFDFDNPSPSFSYSSTFNIRAFCTVNYSGSARGLTFSSEYSDIYFNLKDIKTCYGFYSNPNSSTTLLSDLTITLTDKIPSFNSISGSITLTENGTFDVSSYAQAVVDVPPVIEQGDYHDDLVSINQSILIVSASAFVLYFFFCIYRMYFKDIGVN